LQLSEQIHSSLTESVRTEIEFLSNRLIDGDECIDQTSFFVAGNTQSITSFPSFEETFDVSKIDM